MKILVCGERSFLAAGLPEKLRNEGFEVDTFSRGELGRNGNAVYGDVFSMDHNQYLGSQYDVVLNFIIISTWKVSDNLEYIQCLHRFCNEHKVGRLLQVSSISVYPNSATYVDEDSPIETDIEKKGVYAAIKLSVDCFLKNTEKNYVLSFLRPGLVVAPERPVKFGGIIYKLLPGLGIIMGNRDTSMPLVQKKDIHEGIIRMLRSNNFREVYLFNESRGGTKGDFIKKYYKGWAIPMPRRMVLSFVKILRFFGVISKRHVEMFKGLFKTTFFDSTETEFSLQMSFSANSVAVVGAGAYGSYVTNRLLEVEGKPNVTLFDIGDEHLKDEDAARVGSEIVGAKYTGLQKGRYFGFGGASVKWGGGILLFSDNDFANPSAFMKGIVKLNNKYRDLIFKRFKFKYKFDEEHKKHGMFTRTGLWLGYFSRDLFTYFKVRKTPICLRRNCRVSRFVVEPVSRRVIGIEYITSNGKTKHGYFDQYFLCAGAFESNRIVLSSGMAKENSIHFSDHISQRMFTITGSQVLDGYDMQFGKAGTSLVTKRLIGEIDDVSYFVLPIFNEHFPFFKNLKEVLFRGNFNFSMLGSILRDIPSVAAFAFSLFFKGKLYVYKNQWALNIDMENLTRDSSISLSEDRDGWGINKLRVDFRIGDNAQYVLETARAEIKAYLDECGFKYESCNDIIHVEKCEDTYHPYAMFMSDADSVEDYFTRYPNLLIVNTGVLPRAGGINCTGACFPLVEEYVGEYYSKRVR